MDHLGKIKAEFGQDLGLRTEEERTDALTMLPTNAIAIREAYLRFQRRCQHGKQNTLTETLLCSGSFST